MTRMRSRSQQFRVGLMVLASVVTFVGLVLFILGSSLQGEVQRYYILFSENVKGMVIGSKVNFQGVPIGRVTDIRFRSGNTMVEVSVDPSRAVIQNVTVARLDRLLVTGQVTVEFEGYRPDARELPEGAVIPARANAIRELTTGLPDVMHRAHGNNRQTRC